MNKWKNWAGCAVVAAGLMMTTASQASLYFWGNAGGDNLYSNANNWSPTGNPGATDLAVSTITDPITINGDWTVDSFRLEGGSGAVTQSSGTLTIADGGDTGLWICENGPGTATYTLNGGNILLNDASDNFDIGRNNDTVGYFYMNGGTVTNNGTVNAFFVGRFGGSYGEVDMTAGVLNGPNADTHIGLDGAAVWNQSGGTFNCAGLQIGRFASPFATVNLSGTATWNAGLVLLADGHGAFSPPNSGPVNLNIAGNTVNFNSSGLVVRTYGSVNFDAQSVGVSTMHLGNGQLLLQSGSLTLANLPAATALNQKIVLLDQIGPYTGDAQFANAPAGTVYSGGSFSWQLNYTTTNIFLASVPLCVPPNIGIQPQTQTVALNNSVTFSVGAGGSDLLYQWQTNGVDIAGANSSSYTIASTAYSDALTYRVKVSNTCSGLTATSSNAVLTVVPPWQFITWTDAAGGNLYSNPANWDAGRLPDAGDFCFVANTTNQLVINGDFQVDTMRTGGGTSVLHTNGTLTIWNGVWTDNGLYVGDNGDNGGISSYTLNGGKIVVQDNDGFHVGSNGSATSTFNFLSGSITNLAGDCNLGLDGVCIFNQPSGVFKVAGVQISHYASPHTEINLSGNAIWDAGLVLLADGHGVFNPRNTNNVYLTLTGPNVGFKCQGLVLWNEARVTFDGTGGGVSPMDFQGGQFLLTYGQLFLTNLPTVQSNSQQIVLMKNIGAYTGANTQFTNALDGTVYASAAHTSGWQLKYQGSPATNIVLVALPLINFTSTAVSGGNVTVKFAAGTSDTTASFVLQSSATVNGTYADVSPVATITQLSPGNFQAVTAVNGATRFYRVRR